MADWRQIQARIRKAKNAADAHAKLTELYQRTRDAMVAWELGVIEEKAGQIEEAVKWYKTAVERFRRADWKKKAEDALTRLGAEDSGDKPGKRRGTFGGGARGKFGSSCDAEPRGRGTHSAAGAR